MRKNRNEIQVMFEFLSCINDGENQVSNILRKVNITYTRMGEISKYLEERGMIKTIQNGDKTTFEIQVVTAMVQIKADTEKIEDISSQLSKLNFVEDIYLVTGNWDMVLKVRFPDMNQLRSFLIRDIRKIEGVKDTYTSMVISIFKDRGVVFR